MTKVAYNDCYGGFSLSNAAYEAWLDRKEIAWEKNPEPRFAFMAEYYKKGQIGVSGASLYHGGFDDLRSDPDLIAVIEELGGTANGSHANLKIAKVKKGVRYRIDEYDGMESVMTIADYTWETA